MNDIFRSVFVCMLIVVSHSGLTQESQSQEESETSSIWSNISDGAMSLTDTTLQRADELKNNIGDAYNDAVVFSSESISGFLLNLEDRVALLSKLGFEVTSVYVNVGLIPGVSFKVVRVKVLTIEEQNALLKQEEVGIVLQYVVNKLNQAYDMDISGYFIKDVSIRLTINPGAQVHFEKKNSVK